MKKIVDNKGYLDSNKKNETPYKIIQGNKITMKGVSRPIYAIPMRGGQPMDITRMEEGKDYEFPGAEYVMEVPEAEMGGMFKNMLSMPYGQQGMEMRDSERDAMMLAQAKGATSGSFGTADQRTLRNLSNEMSQVDTDLTPQQLNTYNKFNTEGNQNKNIEYINDQVGYSYKMPEEFTRRWDKHNRMKGRMNPSQWDRDEKALVRERAIIQKRLGAQALAGDRMENYQSADQQRRELGMPQGQVGLYNDGNILGQGQVDFGVDIPNTPSNFLSNDPFGSTGLMNDFNLDDLNVNLDNVGLTSSTKRRNGFGADVGNGYTFRMGHAGVHMFDSEGNLIKGELEGGKKGMREAKRDFNKIANNPNSAFNNNTVTQNGRQQFYNYGQGRSLEQSLYGLGQGIEDGNLGNSIGNGLLAGLKGTRSVLAGMGNQRMNNFVEQEMKEAQARALKNGYQTTTNRGTSFMGGTGNNQSGKKFYAEKGGEFSAYLSKYRDGGEEGLDPPLDDEDDKIKKSKMSPRQYRQYWRDKYGSDTMYFKNYLNKTEPKTGKKLIDIVKDVSKRTGVDANILLNTALAEGLDHYVFKEDRGKAYEKWKDTKTYYADEKTGKLDRSRPIDPKDRYYDLSRKTWEEDLDNEEFPIDGYNFLGVDTIGDRQKQLVSKGYLTNDFFNRTQEAYTENEKNEEVKSAMFSNLTDGLEAVSAMLRQGKSHLKNFTDKKGIKLTPRQRQYFENVSYNAGEGNAEEMLMSYKKQGFLENEDFITKRPTKYWKGIHSNVSRRMGAQEAFNDEGVLPYTGRGRKKAEAVSMLEPKGLKDMMEGIRLGRQFAETVGSDLEPKGLVAYEDELPSATSMSPSPIKEMDIQQVVDDYYSNENAPKRQARQEMINESDYKTQEDIMNLQRMLSDRGANLNPEGRFKNDGIDGKIGRVTRQALQDYNNSIQDQNSMNSYKRGGQYRKYQEGGQEQEVFMNTGEQQAMMNMSEGMPQGRKPQQDMSQNTMSQQQMPREEDLLDAVSMIQERQTDILKDTGLSLDEMQKSMGKANRKMSQHEKNLVSEFEQNYLAVMEVSQMLGQSVPPFDIEDPNAKKSKIKVKRKGGKGVQLKKNLKGDKGGINNGRKKYLKRLTSDMDSIRYMAKGGQMSMEEALVGENVTGIDQSMYNIPANAELEAGEYLQQPNGDVQKIQGKKHASGGEKMQLQNGAKVVSDYLTLGGKNAQYYSKQYGIKVSAKDTYAKVVDKYTTKLGIKKMNKEQESIIKKLKDEDKNTKDENTLMLNTDFLSRKLNEIERKKAPLENLRTMMVDDVFNKQEMSKPKSERAESVNREQQSFRKGGGFIDDSQVKALCKKYDIPYERGVQLMKEYSKGGTKIDTYSKGGEAGVPKYQVGGVNDGEIIIDEIESGNYFPQYSMTSGSNSGKKKGNNSNKQSSGSGRAVGYTADQIKMLKDWEIASRRRGFKGKLDFNSKDIGSQAFKLQDFVSKNFPELVVKYFTEGGRPLTAKSMTMLKKSNPTIFKELGLPEYKNPATYTSEQKDLIKEKLQEDGKLTQEFLIEQFRDGKWDFRHPDYEPIKGISVSELGRPKADLSGANIEVNNDVEIPVPPGSSMFQGEEEDEGKNDEEDDGKRRGKPLAFLNLPNQMPLPPDALEAHRLGQISLGRLDPTKVTAQPIINRINDQVNLSLDSIEKQGGSDSLLAQTTIANNAMEKIIEAENQANARNIDLENKAEQYNIAQADREATMNENLNQQFERLQMTAKAKTREDVRNYFDTLQDIQMSNYKTVDSMNKMNQLYDNFYIDANGDPVATNNGKDVISPDLRTYLAWKEKNKKDNNEG